MTMLTEIVTNVLATKRWAFTQSANIFFKHIRVIIFGDACLGRHQLQITSVCEFCIVGVILLMIVL